MPVTFWARTDSGTANNPSLNLTGDAAIEITFVPSGTQGDVVLDYDGGAIDPDTQVVIDGTSYDFVFELSATLPTLNSDGANQVPDQYEGALIFLITVIDYPAPGETTRLVFLPEENATFSDMEAFGNGALNLANIDTTTPGVICFASGTRLMTLEGERPVETLRAGDLVTTRDHGPMPILWTSTTRMTWPGAPEAARPVLISAGAFGPGQPARDLIVSPQHKLLVDSRCLPGSAEALAPAKGLTALRGIRRMNGKREIVYHHVLLERHALLLSEGLPSESFYPGPAALRMLSAAQRIEISRLLGPRPDYGPPAVPSLSVRETARQATASKRRVLASA